MRTRRNRGDARTDDEENRLDTRTDNRSVSPSGPLIEKEREMFVDGGAGGDGGEGTKTDKEIVGTPGQMIEQWGHQIFKPGTSPTFEVTDSMHLQQSRDTDEPCCCVLHIHFAYPSLDSKLLQICFLIMEASWGEALPFDRLLPTTCFLT